MRASADKKGLSLIGFTEHSPRPDGYDYRNEYRAHLTRHFTDYIREVKMLRNSGASGHCQVLLGLEMDWIPAEESFVRKACAQYDYDYLLGSVHFLDHWGFDDGMESWQQADEGQMAEWYEKYFQIWLSMIRSGLFQIASHPDLIKIYSVGHFHKWLAKPQNNELVRNCLETLKKEGMAMEISSAGMRKPCSEFYPCPEIMRMANELGLDISLASDAHNVGDIAAFFPELAAYAKKFGFDRQIIYRQGRPEYLDF